jgi:2-keto-3-deoxy-L-rhamnonate aldolase RhmA
MTTEFEPFTDRRLETAARLKSALRGGESRVGAFLKIPSPDMVEVLAYAGMDFVVADAEHGPITPETCQEMVRAADATGIPLLVRIGETNSPPTVNRFLDTGVAGVKLPRTSSADAIRTQVDSLLHPPLGIRGLAGGRWASYGMRGPLPDLVERLSSALVIVVQIEDILATQHLDEILELEDPDVFFIGPTDLAASMGLRGNKGDPRVVELIAQTLERIRRSGRTAGILASSPAEVTLYTQMGASYLIVNGESLVQWAARLVRDGLRAGLAATAAGGPPP